MAYIEFDHVVKEYSSGSSVIRALDEASFTADQGELSVILGQSGAGKTTALNILGGMDTADFGRVIVGDRDITGLRKRDLVTLPAQRHRLCLPVLQSCAEPDRAGERGTCLTDLPRSFRPGGNPVQGRTGGAHGEFPGTTVRRRTNSVYPSPARLPKSRSCCCA